VAFTVVPLHSLSLPAETRIPFGEGLVLQDLPEWVKSDHGILAQIHKNDRDLIEDDKHALVADYEADGIGSPDPEWPGDKPKSIQRRKFESAMLANLAIWLRQPCTVHFTVGFHALTTLERRVLDSPIIAQTEHHTRIYCHPKDVSNPIEIHHLRKAGELHASLSAIVPGNPVWAAIRAFWAALTSYRADLRYPLFWQGLESLFSSDTKTWNVTERLCTRLSYFLADNEQTQKDLFAKANVCYNVRSKIIHGRWQPGVEIDAPMADTEAIARTVVRNLLETPGMLSVFASSKRDEFLDTWEQSKAFTPPPLPK
jgi:hypothetical protein